MTRLLGYARVSTDDQAHSGYGLASQVRQIEQACEQRGWKLDGICRDEGLSAKSLERPALLDALAKVARKRGPNGLIVAKLDRLTRSVIDFATLLEWFNAAGATLVALDFDLDTGTPGGRLIAHIMSAVAEWERETIGQRTRDGLAAARAQGRGVNGPSVAGTPEVAQRILALRAQGMSLQGIVDRLNADGVPTVRGAGVWRKSALQTLLWRKSALQTLLGHGRRPVRRRAVQLPKIGGR